MTMNIFKVVVMGLLFVSLKLLGIAEGNMIEESSETPQELQEMNNHQENFQQGRHFGKRNSKKNKRGMIAGRGKMQNGPQNHNTYIVFSDNPDKFDYKDAQLIAAKASVPDVLVDSKGTIYVYFVDAAEMSSRKKLEHISVMTSTDRGVTWTLRKKVTIENSPAKRPVDPDVVITKEGKFRLYYYEMQSPNRKEKKKGPRRNANKNLSEKSESESVKRVYSAISDDGINFTHEEGLRLEDKLTGNDPDVVKLATGHYRLYIKEGVEKIRRRKMKDGNLRRNSHQNNSKKQDIHDQKVISYYSEDGLNFTKEEGYRLENISGPPGAIILEDKKIRVMVPEKGGIVAYDSANGLDFQKSGIVLEGKRVADPSMVKLSDKSYLLVYKTMVQSRSRNKGNRFQKERGAKRKGGMMSRGRMGRMNRENKRGFLEN